MTEVNQALFEENDLVLFLTLGSAPVTVLSCVTSRRITMA